MANPRPNDGPDAEPNRGWWLDELAHAGQEHLDVPYVAGYDAKAQVDPTEDIDTLVAHGTNADSVLLDLGAGTGTFTLAAAAVCKHVVAVDVSPAMVDALRARVAAAGFDNVTVVNGGFLSYVHEGDPFDVVHTRNALHQIPDFWKAVALDRMHSMLRPGGLLRLRDLIYDFDPSEVHDRMRDWMAGAVDDSAIGWTADELAEHVRIEFSTYSWLFDVMLERTGFDIVERDYVRGAYGAYTCRRQ